MGSFNFSISLDPIHYIVPIEQQDIEIANFIELVDNIKDYSKILYNKNLDYIDLDKDGFVNLFNYDPNDFAFIALSEIDVEYIEEIYGYSVEDDCFSELNIPKQVKPYLIATFYQQQEKYFNTFVLSQNIDNIYTFSIKNKEISFKCQNSFDCIKEDYSKFLSYQLNNTILDDNLLLENTLIIISSFWKINNFIDIVFSPVCIPQIQNNKNINIKNILETIIRSVYFPSYKLSNQDKTHDLQIECHPDSGKKIHINQKNCSVYRAYVLPFNTRHRSKTLERLFYIDYNEKIIFIGYDKNHELNYDIYKNPHDITHKNKIYTISKLN